MDLPVPGARVPRKGLDHFHQRVSNETFLPPLDTRTNFNSLRCCTGFLLLARSAKEKLFDTKDTLDGIYFVGLNASDAYVVFEILQIYSNNKES